MENYFCSKCDEWRVISGSIANIKRHVDFHTKEEEDEKNHHILSLNSGIESERDYAFKFISKQIRKFILLNGYPFPVIEDIIKGDDLI